MFNAAMYIDTSPQGILYNLDRLLVWFSSNVWYIYLSGNTGWNISSNTNSTNLCFIYNSSNKCYHDITGNTYITGDLYRSGISLTSTLSNLNAVNISNASWCIKQSIIVQQYQFLHQQVYWYWTVHIAVMLR